MKKIKIVACAFSLLLAGKLSAQISLGIQSGVGGLNYSAHNTSHILKPGVGAEIGLNHMFSKHWGIVSGMGMNQFAEEANTITGSTLTSNQTDDMGASFEYRVKSSGYKETQRFISLYIPLMLQYRSSGKSQWYFNGGGTLFIPSAVKVKATASQLEISGYYPDVNVEIKNLPQHGFGTVTGWESSTSYSLKPGMAASAGTGISFKLSAKNRIDIGIYAAYVLNNMKDYTGKPVVTYEAGGVNRVRANSILATGDTKEIKLFSAGLQLKLSFGTKSLSKNQNTGTQMPRI